MAGDDHLQRIPMQNIPDSANRLWMAGGFGHLFVSPRFPVRDIPRDLENFFLEIGPINFYGNRKLSNLTGKVQIKFIDSLAVSTARATENTRFRVGACISASP